MLFKMTFLTTFISIIKLYNQICQIFFLNLMNKLKIMIFNFMVKRNKSGLVPPTVHYCGHNAKKIGAKKSLLKICTLHTVSGHLSAALSQNIVSSLSSFSNMKHTFQSVPPFRSCFFLMLLPVLLTRIS